MRFNLTGPVNTVDWLTSTLILAQPFFDVRRSMFTSYVFCLHRSIVFSYFVSVESDRKCHWNENLATKSNGAKRERNWTDLETEAFCDILADPEFSFSTTLETKVLKKQANKGSFWRNSKTFENFLWGSRVSRHRTYFDEAPQKELSIDKLRNKYHDLKKSSRQIVDTNLHISDLTSPNLNLTRPIVDLTDHRPNSQWRVKLTASEIKNFRRPNSH